MKYITWFFLFFYLTYSWFSESSLFGKYYWLARSINLLGTGWIIGAFVALQTDRYFQIKMKEAYKTLNEEYTRIFEKIYKD